MGSKCCAVRLGVQQRPITDGEEFQLLVQFGLVDLLDTLKDFPRKFSDAQMSRGAAVEDHFVAIEWGDGTHKDSNP